MTTATPESVASAIISGPGDQGAGQGPIGPLATRRLAERRDRLPEPAFHQVLEAVERDLPGAGQVVGLLEKKARLEVEATAVVPE